MSTLTLASRPCPADLVRRLTSRPQLAGVGLVLGVSALLDFVRLDQNGYANTYYSAAVRSMLGSWRNFFFVSFDPGGLVSVDKPPLALWLEAGSAKLFGFSGFAILLPEALAGVASVWLLYLLVARYFGWVAGLVAALALAVSPVSVSVNRDNNPDALLVLLLVAAVYVGARAVESGRLRTLVLAAVLVGLAFNTKMLAAMIVVPGLALAYLVFARVDWKRRLGRLAVAGAVLVAVSGAWIAAVQLTPAADRPYVGSTTDNSALSLAFDYNGLGRVTGQTGGTSFGGGGGGAFSGSPGPLRLLNDALGDQGGWLLALALVGGVSALLAAVLARCRRELAVLTVLGAWFACAAVVFSYSSGIIHTYYVSALAPAACGLVGAGVVALWRDARRGRLFLVLPVLALALSAWLEVTLLRRFGYLPWLQPLVLVATIFAIGLLAALAYPGWPARVRALVGGAALTVAVAGLLAAPAAWSATTWKSAVNGVFPGAGPSFVSGLGTTRTGGVFGGGGPSFGGRGGFTPPAGRTFNPPTGGAFAPPGRGAFGPGRGGRPSFGGAGRGGVTGPGGFGSSTSAAVTAALKYVKTHGASSRFGLIVSSEQEAAPYVVRGEPVAAMGGFTGRETVLTHAYLSSLVRSGAARYFLLGGSNGFAGPGGSNNEAVTTITSTCKQVPAAAWSGSSTGSGATLYDCAGKADAIAHAAG